MPSLDFDRRARSRGVLVGCPAPLKVSSVFLSADQLSALMTYRHEAEHSPARNKHFPRTAARDFKHFLEAKADCVHFNGLQGIHFQDPFGDGPPSAQSSQRKEALDSTVELTPNPYISHSSTNRQS